VSKLAGWLVGWFVGRLVRWFIGSLVRWFVGSLVRWFVGSLRWPCMSVQVDSLHHATHTHLSTVPPEFSMLPNPIGAHDKPATPCAFALALALALAPAPTSTSTPALESGLVRAVSSAIVTTS
jgi:hypothetical protein